VALNSEYCGSVLRFSAAVQCGGSVLLGSAACCLRRSETANASKQCINTQTLPVLRLVSPQVEGSQGDRLLRLGFCFAGGSGFGAGLCGRIGFAPSAQQQAGADHQEAKRGSQLQGIGGDHRG